MACADKSTSTVRGMCAYLSDEQVHYKSDTENGPLVVIDSGDTVIVWTPDISDNQVGRDPDASALAAFDWDRTYPLTDRSPSTEPRR